jgi:8-oxo-dGTP pyrophosphatase MutT (NUDIX family)
MNTYDPNYIPKKSFAIVGQKALVINPKNQILLLQRSEKSGLGGKWSLPGGALEHNEEPFGAMKREIDEETQLVVKDLKPFHVKSYLDEDGNFVVIIGYECKTDSEIVQLNWEHDDFRWLTKQEALMLDLTPDGKTFIDFFNS